MINTNHTSFSFPLKISPNGAYFTDSTGNPFFWHGDTCWKLFWEFTEEEADTYLQNRAAAGFTVIQVQLLPHREYQANKEGHTPFAERGNITKINEAYFAHVDRIVAKAAAYGLALVIAPMWLSGWEQDWHQYFNTETAPLYASIIANRYKDYHNIVAWIQGGDDDALPLHDAVHAAAKVFKQIAPHQLNTYHAWAKGAWQFFQDADWYDFHMAYSYSHEFLLEQIEEVRTLSPRRPVILGETHYESNEGITAETIRRYAYTASFYGLAGHTYGNKDIWIYTYFWLDALHSEASYHMTNLKEFMDRIPWWTLKPTVGTEIFRPQENERRKQRLDVHSPFVPGAYSKEYKTAIAYFMDHREFFPDPYWTSAEFFMQWFDPVSGRFYPALPGQTGSFRTPGSNCGGGQDWVLLISAR